MVGNRRVVQRTPVGGLLGQGGLGQAGPAPTATSALTPTPANDPFWSDAKEQWRAGVSGATDALTFGLADPVSSGYRALVSPGGLAGWNQRYRAELAKQKAQDQYDAAHYGTARTVGQLAGTGVQVGLLGGLDGIAAGGVRMAEAAPLLWREAGQIAGGGGALGVGGQLASDAQSGHRSSAGDLLAAGLGGATDALVATRLGPGHAGMIGGATTSALQDVFNGRPVSWERAEQAGGLQGWMAGSAGLLPRLYVDGLPSLPKGDLGEELGKVRVRAGFDTPLPQANLPTKGGRPTKVDIPTARGKYIEVKTGPKAKLSPAQTRALRQYPDKYSVYHLLGRDFGRLYGVPAGIAGYSMLPDENGPQGLLSGPGITGVPN